MIDFSKLFLFHFTCYSHFNPNIYQLSVIHQGSWLYCSVLLFHNIELKIIVDLIGPCCFRNTDILTNPGAMTLVRKAKASMERPFLTSVTAWIDAPCFRRSSITFILFFLQAMWRGVKPFWKWERTHFWMSSCN